MRIMPSGMSAVATLPLFKWDNVLHHIIKIDMPAHPEVHLILIPTPGERCWSTSQRQAELRAVYQQLGANRENGENRTLRGQLHRLALAIGMATDQQIAFVQIMVS